MYHRNPRCVVKRVLVFHYACLSVQYSPVDTIKGSHQKLGQNIIDCISPMFSHKKFYFFNPNITPLTISANLEVFYLDTLKLGQRNFDSVNRPFELSFFSFLYYTELYTFFHIFM